ncbi:XRE family transcriptional regulator [Agromyces sp. SYSU K20354]|uniref:XRE family transcriptional regulator n=1 Tax=Agromyces cavernae TaxID=2898659 RepID=UPI001E4BD05C|nr:XRE family transcriptional regulator [Agromyces cavernae]MCD2441424.1 XRE family transcriptional regulator [Agromyces cavernae]
MESTTFGETLRARRVRAGLTQRELSVRARIPQPNISAYELGRREPNPETTARLNRALSAPSLSQVRGARVALLEAAARRGLGDIRVFGSVARNEADADSDVDLLVHPSANTSLFDLAGFMVEAEAVLGTSVDVVSDRGQSKVLDRILAEAVPL